MLRGVYTASIESSGSNCALYPSYRPGQALKFGMDGFRRRGVSLLASGVTWLHRGRAVTRALSAFPHAELERSLRSGLAVPEPYRPFCSPLEIEKRLSISDFMNGPALQ